MSLFGGRKPGFLTRLSNIIIIQVLFVFAAVAIVLFYPAVEEPAETDYPYLNEQFNRIGGEISACFGPAENDIHHFIAVDTAIRKRLTELLSHSNFLQGYLYVSDEAGYLRRVFGSTNGRQGQLISAAEEDFTRLVTAKVLDYQTALPQNLAVPIMVTSRYSGYYFRFDIQDTRSAVLVAIAQNNPATVSRSETGYTLLLLFLASTLVSLLTVHLINNRFRKPLERLINGFERTAKGELYFVVDTDLDNELRELATAFNDMSKTLWDNHQRLNDYNTRLEATNQMLAQSQEFLGTLIDNSPACVVSASPDGKIMVFNRKASEAFAIDRRDVMGSDVNRLFTRSIDKIKADKAVTADPHSLEVLCRRSDGSLFPAFLTASPIMAENGATSAYLYVIRDISESKNFQEMMVRLDRYYTRGEMAGDIAHEINNFLAVLSGNLELMPLFLKKQDTEKIEKKLEVMKATVDKIAHFTDGLMDLNEGEVSFEPADINQLIETVITFLKPQNKFDKLQIVTDLSTDIPLVQLDSGQIQQLLVNLIYNASEALAERAGDGRISIKSGLAEDRSEQAIYVEVKDNGAGVPKEHEGMLFVKRFTTKRKGHGIGLITCKRILETHQGTIEYVFDNGATFRFRIPVRHQAVETDSDEAETSRVSQPAV